MCTLLALSLCLAVGPQDQPDLLLVVGAPGTAEYNTMFQGWADRWEKAAAKGRVACQRIGSDKGKGQDDRERMKKYLATQAKKENKEPLWIVLIGHGTFDGRNAKFNLRGPDLKAQDLAQWLAPLKRPVVVINCASASSPFLNLLSGSNRVIVTATRSGYEQNFARFGQYLAEAITDPVADLDKDEQVSLLEAYLTASNRVAEFYKSNKRLATEHSLLDDTGDKLGTPADWYRGIRPVRRAKGGTKLDGLRAHQLHLIPSKREQKIPAEVRRQRDKLELKVAALREQKDKLTEDEYYARLEKLMLQIARLYRDMDKKQVRK